MSEVIDAFNNVFRDYAVAGVPSSGAHNVIKADARGLGAIIEAEFTQLGYAMPVYPEQFAPEGVNIRDGSTSARAAMQACHDWCWNGGNIRGAVCLIPGVYPYLVEDHNADGKALIFNDGVSVIGLGKTSMIKGSGSAKTLYIQRVAGGWRKAALRDFWIDGNNAAASALEFYGSAYTDVCNVVAINATRGFVIDGSQNYHLRNCVAQNCDINWSYLNGAGSITADCCGSDAAGSIHILVDNDESYPGFGLIASGLAYAVPTKILINGGVYEREKSGGALKTVVRLNAQSDFKADGAVFAGLSTCDSIVDFGRHNLAATYVSASIARVASSDITSKISVGQRVKLIGSTSTYGVIASAAFTTNTDITLTMDAGQSVPTDLATIEFGRSGDGATATWASGLTRGVLTDCQIYGGGITAPAIRSGSQDATFERLTFLFCSGDWIQTSRPMWSVRNDGNLAATKKRTAHFKSLNTGAAEISFTPLRQVNSGTFEDPGDATTLYYSGAGAAWRWRDPINAAYRTLPSVSTITAAPTFNATHIGQTIIDTNNKKVYVATATGTGAADWSLLN